VFILKNETWENICAQTRVLSVSAIWPACFRCLSLKMLIRFNYTDILIKFKSSALFMTDHPDKPPPSAGTSVPCWAWQEPQNQCWELAVSFLLLEFFAI
jgi:hypothetical protein